MQRAQRPLFFTAALAALSLLASIVAPAAFSMPDSSYFEDFFDADGNWIGFHGRDCYGDWYQSGSQSGAAKLITVESCNSTVPFFCDKPMVTILDSGGDKFMCSLIWDTNPATCLCKDIPSGSCVPEVLCY